MPALISGSLNSTEKYLFNQIPYLCINATPPKGRCIFFLFYNKQGRIYEWNHIFDKEALEKLKGELQKMKSVDRPAASRAIAEARKREI